jgi:multiple sugar transport system permease protein
MSLATRVGARLGAEEPDPSATTGLPAVRPPRGRRRKGDGRAAFWFLLPWTAGLVLITLGPMLGSLALSFTEYNLIQPPEFVGGENYERLLSDARLGNSLIVSFLYVFISVPLQLALSLGLAVVLDRGMRGLSFYRSVFYLPSMLGGSVAISILWRQIFGNDGLVNQVLGVFGIEAPGLVTTPDTALSTLILLNVWTFGAPMVIFLAALRQIPVMYYEAAKVDGATARQRFFRITLPLLTPIIFFNLVLQLIHAFQAFTQAFIVSNGTGGPADSTMFMTLYLYQQAFTRFDMGYASAVAWLLMIVIAAITAANFFFSRYWVFYDD